jgi:hypothetical protein
MPNTNDMQAKLKQVEHLLVQGHTVGEAIARAGVSPAVYTLWLQEHDGQVRVPLERLEHLHAENSRLRKLVARLNHELKNQKSKPRVDYFAKPLNTRAT